MRKPGECLKRNKKKTPPPARTLLDWKKRFLETLSVIPRKPVGDHSARRVSDENVNAILNAFGDDPSTSQRKVAQEVGLSVFTVNKTLKLDGLKPWKLTSVQELRDGDKLKRLQFCQFIIEKQRDDPSFFCKINFSDEATFHVNGRVNRHNQFIYAHDNPHATEEHFMKSVGITCWAMVSPIHGISYEIIEGTMNSAIYHRILLEKVIPLLTQERNQRELYQQDGAPPHFALLVRNSLDTHLQNRWIGRSGPVPWPPRSPDLSVNDSWLWGHIRNNLYKSPRPRTIQELHEKLVHLLENIDRATIRRAYDNFLRRCSVCIEQEGGHFEQFL